jgi:hypothetical protein
MTSIEEGILYCETEIKKIDSILEETEKLRFSIFFIFRLDLLLFYIKIKMMRNRILKNRNRVVKVIKYIKEIQNDNKL